jgi:hypothetical protein
LLVRLKQLKKLVNMCQNCGNNSCQGNCGKKCIKVNVPSSWISGQTGIPGADGDDGVGIVNIIDNGDGTMTIFLSDGSDYTINLPASTGKHVVAINPVPGGDTQWELEYDDASTLIIPAAYYLNQIGSGVALLDNQVNHPTFIKGLEPKLLGSNSKIEVIDDFSDVQFNVKQYGRITDQSVVYPTPGVGSVVTVNQCRYRTLSDSMAFVVKSGGGPVIENHVTQRADFHLSWIDAYHSRLYYHIVHDFTLTYNDFSYQNSLDKKFYFAMPVTLTEVGGGFPAGFPPGFWANVNQAFYHGMHDTAIYDLYDIGAAGEDFNNKIRRYGNPDRVCTTCIQDGSGSAEPGWPTNPAGNRLVFKYLVANDLINPGGGDDIMKTYRFEAIGSILAHHAVNTDFMSTIPHEEINH